MIAIEKKKINLKALNCNNTLVLGAFLSHIAICLLQLNSDENACDFGLDETWDERLDILRECYDEWDDKIIKCCNVTPITHEIWKIFADSHRKKTKANEDVVDRMKYLVLKWIDLQKEYDTFMPYPTGFEQYKYKTLPVIRSIWKDIEYEAINQVFQLYFILATNKLTMFVFSTFLKHIMVRLAQETQNINKREMNVLLTCCAEWNLLVDECCQLIPINDKIWKHFISPCDIGNKSNETLNNYQLFKYPQYEQSPSLQEQNQFTKLIIKQWSIIAHFVIDGKFEPFRNYQKHKQLYLNDEIKELNIDSNAYVLTQNENKSDNKTVSNIFKILLLIVTSMIAIILNKYFDGILLYILQNIYFTLICIVGFVLFSQLIVQILDVLHDYYFENSCYKKIQNVTKVNSVLFMIGIVLFCNENIIFPSLTTMSIYLCFIMLLLIVIFSMIKQMNVISILIFPLIYVFIVCLLGLVMDFQYYYHYEYDDKIKAFNAWNIFIIVGWMLIFSQIIFVTLRNNDMASLVIVLISFIIGSSVILLTCYQISILWSIKTCFVFILCVFLTFWPMFLSV